MKDQKAKKTRNIVKAKVLKSRRGRPKMTDAEKAADPRKIMMGEIKSDLKKVKKSKKRLGLLLEKAQAEQGILMAALLNSLEKIKIKLKKKPRKAKKGQTGKRGRPRNPGRKPGRKPPVMKSAIKKRGEEKRPGRKPVKKAVARKAVKKTDILKPGTNRVGKPEAAKEEAVKAVSRPTKKQIKKIAPMPIAKPETAEVTSAPANPGVSDTEPKKE